MLVDDLNCGIIEYTARYQDGTPLSIDELVSYYDVRRSFLVYSPDSQLSGEYNIVLTAKLTRAANYPSLSLNFKLIVNACVPLSATSSSLEEFTYRIGDDRATLYFDDFLGDPNCVNFEYTASTVITTIVGGSEVTTYVPFD